jgi:hypothetical protein
MAGKNTAVFGIYPSYEAVERAVDALKSSGFRNTDISVLFPENIGTKDFAHAKGTKAPEGAATGAASGAVVGGALGWLVGIGALAIPGLGPFIAAGPIMAALAGVGVGGTVGGVTGALVGMGIPEYEAKRYEGRLKKGGILLSVHSDNSEWTKRAKEVLERTGAEDIASTGETKGDTQNTDRPMPRSEASSAAMRSVVDNDDEVEAEIIERERIVAADPDAIAYERDSSIPKKSDMK